jgi:hypothetical protein
VSCARRSHISHDRKAGTTPYHAADGSMEANAVASTLATAERICLAALDCSPDKTPMNLTPQREGSQVTSERRDIQLWPLWKVQPILRCS